MSPTATDPASTACLFQNAFTRARSGRHRARRAGNLAESFRVSPQRSSPPPDKAAGAEAPFIIELRGTGLRSQLAHLTGILCAVETGVFYVCCKLAQRRTYSHSCDGEVHESQVFPKLRIGQSVTTPQSTRKAVRFDSSSSESAAANFSNQRQRHFSGGG